MIKRIFFLWMLISTALTFDGARLLFAESKYSSLQCDTLMESDAAGKMQGKFFIKGKKVRMEGVSSGASGINMITLYDGQKAYAYFPEQNMAMVMPASHVSQQMPVINSEEFKKKIVGEETIDGRLCDIYQFSDKKGATYKVWVARDIEFPLKSEAAGTRTYYKNIRVNAAINDGIFELPAGVQIQDMGSMMQQAGER